MIVIDTSVVIAILKDEAERELFVSIVAGDDGPVMSSVSVYEAILVAAGSRGITAPSSVLDLLSSANVKILPFGMEDAKLAGDVYSRYGKGLNAKARLNLCDCAAYALAEKLNVALLFKGDDFKNTPITSAA